MNKFYYISLPKDERRCIEILRCFNDKPVFMSPSYKYAWCDESGIYFTEELQGEGVGIKIEQEPTIEVGQEVVHFRSGRTEYIKGTALLKTLDGWKDCVVYGKEGETYVRELENFKEAFINKK